MKILNKFLSFSECKTNFIQNVFCFYIYFIISVFYKEFLIGHILLNARFVCIWIIQVIKIELKMHNFFIASIKEKNLVMIQTLVCFFYYYYWLQSLYWILTLIKVYYTALQLLNLHSKHCYTEIFYSNHVLSKSSWKHLQYNH